jgi:hypothetical protein
MVSSRSTAPDSVMLRPRPRVGLVVHTESPMACSPVTTAAPSTTRRRRVLCNPPMAAGRAPIWPSQLSIGERRPVASITRSTARSPWSVRTPVTCGGVPGTASKPTTRTPQRRVTPGSTRTARCRTQSRVERRVISIVSRSSPGHAVVSASVAGIWVDSGTSATPAASNPWYTSGSRSTSSSRHLSRMMCGCTICGAVGRNADTAAASTSAPGSNRSCSTMTSSCPARASSSEANRPAHLRRR